MHAPICRFLALHRLSAAALVALLGACASPVPAPPPAGAPVVIATPSVSQPQAPVVSEPAPTHVSHAVTPRDYRKDGAQHIYGKNSHRIFKGKMPPLLQGVGTMQLELDHRGQIVAMNWMRPPSHPVAKAEIERVVREAAPYPAPVRMGRVVYTDTWLWDKSGHFQLDTLTEGQRDR
jgi:periplasmic protein TonB